MSLPRPSGLKAPSKIGKPSGVPAPRTSIPTPASSKAQSPEAPDPPSPLDDYIIGDRVFISGTKPGYIAFLGETQFAPGEWAGVVLDEPVGKNDGSVSGVQYFQCEAKRGVFARISKLSRTPGIAPPATPRPDDVASESGAQSGKANGAPIAPVGVTAPQKRPTTPRIGLVAPSKNTATLASLNKPAMTSTPMKSSLKEGDRVLVGGTKLGTLRFLGPADFAKGDWAGVDLDDPLGKNDGAVAGKRYFSCKPMHGLFAPLHKVARLPPGSTPSPQTRTLANTSLRMSRERSGSQDSVSSISSTTSSVSRSRVRLGVTSLANKAKTSHRPATLNISATTSALQKALKEKEEHIEQLLKERDLERSEVARAASQVDDAEGELSMVKAENERFRDEGEETIRRLRTVVQELEKSKLDLSGKLEDEKRKIEDLQFQIEEEAISKDDLESKTEEEEVRIRDLERNYKKEKERADKFEKDFLAIKVTLEQQTKNLQSAEDMQTDYLDQIEELTHKLSQSENKVKSYDSSRLEEGAKTSQVGMDLAEKMGRVVELEELLSTRNKELKKIHGKLAEMEEDLKTSLSKRDKLQESVDELTNKLSGSDQNSNDLMSEVQNLQTKLSGMQRELEASNSRSNELTEEKNQLELQMTDMMKNSGDSSKKLSLLNDQLKEKTRKIEELQTDLSSSTQKSGKINDELGNLRRETEKEKENLINKNNGVLKEIKGQLEDVQKELEKAKTKMTQMDTDFNKEKEEIVSRKTTEISELKKQFQLNAEELSKQEIQTQAHKQVLDQITMEKEALKFEKEKVEKQLKRIESEKEAANTELIQAKVAVSKLTTDCQQAVKDRQTSTEQLQDAKDETEKVSKSKAELQKQRDDAASGRDKVTEERDQYQREVMESRAALKQKEMQTEQLQKEVEKLRLESEEQQKLLSQLSEKESSASLLKRQLDESKDVINNLHSELGEVQVERDSMRAQLEFSNLVVEERKRLEEQNSQLHKEVEGMRKREQVDKLETDKSELTGKIDVTTTQLHKKGGEVDLQKKQIQSLQNENSDLAGYKSSLLSLEKERIDLNDKINRLETALADSRANANLVNNVDSSGNDAVARIKAEKEAGDNQLEFLNSVIVELQRKNDEMKVRLEAVESGILNGGTDTAMELSSPTRRAPPRLFCDICDVFDKHDTDDCPLQAMDMDDSPPPTTNHGDRRALRPYCDICEEFHSPCQPDDVPGEPEISDDTDTVAEDMDHRYTPDSLDSLDVGEIVSSENNFNVIESSNIINQDGTDARQLDNDWQELGDEQIHVDDKSIEKSERGNSKESLEDTVTETEVKKLESGWQGEDSSKSSDMLEEVTKSATPSFIGSNDDVAETSMRGEEADVSMRAEEADVNMRAEEADVSMRAKEADASVLYEEAAMHDGNNEDICDSEHILDTNTTHLDDDRSSTLMHASVESTNENVEPKDDFSGTTDTVDEESSVIEKQAKEDLHNQPGLAEGDLNALPHNDVLEELLHHVEDKKSTEEISEDRKDDYDKNSFVDDENIAAESEGEAPHPPSTSESDYQSGKDSVGSESDTPHSTPGAVDSSSPNDDNEVFENGESGNEVTDPEVTSSESENTETNAGKENCKMS